MKLLYELLPSSLLEIGLILLLILMTLAFYLRTKKSEVVQKYREKHLLKIVSELSNHAMIIFSKEHQVLFINQAMQKYIQIDNGSFLKPTDNTSMFRLDNKTISLSTLINQYARSSSNETITMAHTILKTKGQEKAVNLRISGFTEYGNDTISNIGISIYDITNKLELSKLYYQNTVTGLPNHNKALADIGLMANKVHTRDKKFALIVISVDNFSELISILGYKQSLASISSLAKYFQRISRELKLELYHMTSNNFLIIAPDIQSENDALSLVEKFKKDTKSLFFIENKNMHFTFSTGISIYPDNDISTLLDKAYQALVSANRRGNDFAVISKVDNNKMDKEAPIKFSEIQRALKSREFTMFYQPIYDIDENVIVGAEALIRWIHPDKGLIPPDMFIPIAEKTGFISEMGRFAIRSVVKQLHKWNELEFREIQVSINLSPRELESKSPFEQIASLVEKYKVKTSQIKIEVTENAAMSDQNQSQKHFSKLRNMGVEISLDDFGTGYSSFSMLESLPINTVKIDKSFILDLATNEDHRSIVKAIIVMAHSLGMKVVAEGIENEKSKQILKLYGCDYGQGYHYGRPVPSYEFQEHIRTKRQALQSDNMLLEVREP